MLASVEGMALRALVTNDDGIESEGIRQLALAAVRARLDVIVAAPVTEASGTSASINSVQQDGRIVVEPRTLTGLHGVRCFAVAAAPGFIVLVAHRGAFGEPPDLVLSGVNRGPNTGSSVMHSGTVGATLTAGMCGSRGLAVSINSGKPEHWSTAAAYAGRVLPMLTRGPESLVINLNVPDVDEAEVRGLVRAGLARFGAVQMTVSEVGHGYVRAGLERSQDEFEAGSDAAMLAAGYATLTPLAGVRERRDVELPELADLLGEYARS